MNEFSVFRTIHLDLKNLSLLQIPNEKCLIYVWFENHVLGHFYFEPKEKGNIRIEFLAKLTFALIPKIENELAMHTVCMDSVINWKTLILGEDFNGLTEFLKQLLINKIETNQSLSVIVCTNNNIDGLRNCIAALKCSISEKDEIIVVDYSKEHNYTELLLKNYPRIIHIKESNLSLSKARNSGIMMAKNSIVAFTDERVMVSKTWADEIRNSFLNKNVMAISGLVIPVEINSATQLFFNRKWAYNRGYSEQIFDYKYFTDHIENRVPFWGIAVRSNMAFRKSIFEKVSLFDEDMDNQIIDEIMVYTILSKGWECVYQPKIYVYEQAKINTKELKKQLYNHMKAQTFWLLQTKKYNPIYKNLPVHYFRRYKHYCKGGQLESISGIKAEIRGILAGTVANFLFRLKRVESNNKEIIFKAITPQFTTK